MRDSVVAVMEADLLLVLIEWNGIYVMLVMIGYGGRVVEKMVLD